MDTETLLAQAEQLVSAYALTIDHPQIQSNLVNIYIEPENLKNAVKTLFDADWGYLITISTYDTVVEDGGRKLGLIYHFANHGAICSLRFFLPLENPSVDSICDIVPSATLYEREMMEMFGIDVIGTPDRERLLLPDDWPDGVYPLRKSFTGLSDDGRWEKPEVK